MIPSEFRLKKERNFEILFSEGDFEGGDIVDLKYWKIDIDKYSGRFNENDLKIGFIVSSNISNKATVRNKKKRQIREATKELLNQFNKNKGYLAAILAKETILGSDFEDIKDDIRNLLTKVGIIE